MEIPFVSNLINIEQREFSFSGKVEIFFPELGNPLVFDFIISSEYPLKSYDSESIKFYNKELVEYKHVMQSGLICIHTAHNTNFNIKLKIDFDALRDWIIKYYIKKNDDLKYEHIIVGEKSINDTHYSYVFSETNKAFSKGEYGTVKLYRLNHGLYKDKPILNFIVQHFQSSSGELKPCAWNQFYLDQKPHIDGLYYFLEDTPAEHDKFAYTKWGQLRFSAIFLTLIDSYEQQNLDSLTGLVIPLFLGYKISPSEIHWQVALLEIGRFPIKGVPERKHGRKTGFWITALNDTEIIWGITRNASYKYFFGRGIFSKRITEKRILIIGIGAIGSMIAQTLTRCGCRYIDFIDYDIKEPENVCRSEYQFSNGITNKTFELQRILYDISPFLNSTPLNNNYFERLIKTFYLDKEYQNQINEELLRYDLVFDCTTDNDLMYVLDSLELGPDLVNISITNHAREMVCAFHPNIYNFVNNQFSNVLKNDIKDLYEPTGCWNPTFKASYNDISTLVQLMLKHINKILNGDRPKRNFVIQEIEGNLKIVEF